MDFKICSLASGSKGNCILISTCSTNILVDNGIAYKTLKQKLFEVGLEPKDISAFVVSHTHSDHIKGLSTFYKENNCPIYVADYDYFLFNTKIDNSLIHKFENAFSVGDISILPFETSHDTDYSHGFCFEHNGKKISIATDLGYISKSVFDKLKCSDIIMLESNYDEFMIENGHYPEFLKNRIRSEVGHLSNDESCATAIELAKKGTKSFLLAHLSQDNNSPEVALKTFVESFKANGIYDDNVSIEVALQFNISKTFYA